MLSFVKQVFPVPRGALQPGTELMGLPVGIAGRVGQAIPVYMRPDRAESPGYESILKRVAADCPRLADTLYRAHDLRIARSVALVGNDRFVGLNELLVHLDGLVRAFDEDDALAQLSFLSCAPGPTSRRL